MKKVICLIACLTLNLPLLFGQPLSYSWSPGTPGNPEQATNLPTFSLEFPGGTPGELVKAIERETRRPLNVIIKQEDQNVQLPPLRMHEVNVAQLFAALTPASSGLVPATDGNSYYYRSYGFKTATDHLAENSIWFFFVDHPMAPAQSTCRFFSLAPYLARGFTVDDITTAIQTGWKMAGITSPPKLNYHKETKLLIACGETRELETIESVLRTLPPTNASTDDMEELRKAIVSLRTAVNNLHITLIPGQNLPYPDPHAQLDAGAKHEEKSGK